MYLGKQCFSCCFVCLSHHVKREDVITEETGITGTPHFIWDIAVELNSPITGA